MWCVLLPAGSRGATEGTDGAERNASGVHGNFGVVVGVVEGVCVGTHEDCRLRTPLVSWPAIFMGTVADD